MQTNLMTVEKELAMRQQCMDMHKRYSFTKKCLEIMKGGKSGLQFTLVNCNLHVHTLISDCRKAIESAQSAADLKLHLEKYHAQIKEVQQTVAEKTSSLEAEAFKTKRLHEELVLMRRKVG